MTVKDLRSHERMYINQRLVLIFSGGLDSTVALYYLSSLNNQVVTLGMDYGQRHRKELLAAQLITKRLGVQHVEVDLSTLRPLLAGSSQTSHEVAVPHGHYTAESMKATVVPNRNMIMISVAIGLAVSLRFNMVCYAAHAGDHAIYPDCREEFVFKMNQVALCANWNTVAVSAPFIRMSKGDIVKLGAELGVPFARTWSCYEGGDTHCGLCGTCVERREAFKQAGVDDPTVYGSPLT